MHKKFKLIVKIIVFLIMFILCLKFYTSEKKVNAFNANENILMLDGNNNLKYGFFCYYRIRTSNFVKAAFKLPGFEQKQIVAKIKERTLAGKQFELPLHCCEKNDIYTMCIDSSMIDDAVEEPFVIFDVELFDKTDEADNFIAKTQIVLINFDPNHVDIAKGTIFSTTNLNVGSVTIIGLQDLKHICFYPEFNNVDALNSYQNGAFKLRILVVDLNNVNNSTEQNCFDQLPANCGVYVINLNSDFFEEGSQSSKYEFHIYKDEIKPNNLIYKIKNFVKI